MKICRGVCGMVLPKSKFSKKTSNPDGLQNECKECRKLLCKSWRAKASLKTKRNHSYKHKYDITVDRYNEMFIDQRGLCLICNEPERTQNAKSGKTLWLAVDHCHTSGKVRGLLCSKCNTALGLFKDNTKNLQGAIKYLKKQKKS